MTFNALSASFATPMTEAPFFESNSISNLLIQTYCFADDCAFKIGPAKAWHHGPRAAIDQRLTLPQS
jgi:hypothetical protein